METISVVFGTFVIAPLLVRLMGKWKDEGSGDDADGGGPVEFGSPGDVESIHAGGDGIVYSKSNHEAWVQYSEEDVWDAEMLCLGERGADDNRRE